MPSMQPTGQINGIAGYENPENTISAGGLTCSFSTLRYAGT